MEPITCLMQIPDTMTTCIDCGDYGILELPYFREVSHLSLLPLKVPYDMIPVKAFVFLSYELYMQPTLFVAFTDLFFEYFYNLF